MLIGSRSHGLPHRDAFTYRLLTVPHTPACQPTGQTLAMHPQLHLPTQ